MRFLLLLTFLLLSAGVASSSNAVLDADGDELRAGQRYYAQSMFFGGALGGGLELVSLSDRCPLYVATASPWDRVGKPLILSPENPNEDVIREGNTLNIMFAVRTRCPEPTVWKFDEENNLVMTGGASSQSVGTDTGRFSITKDGVVDGVYQINYCPCSIGADRPSCRRACFGGLGVGLVNDKSVLRLGGLVPLRIVFHKVKGRRGIKDPFCRTGLTKPGHALAQ